MNFRFDYLEEYSLKEKKNLFAVYSPTCNVTVKGSFTFGE